MNSQFSQGRMSRRLKTAVHLALGLGAMGIAATPAMAADDEIVEVIVTAQFREQNLQDTPLAITAINAATLEARSQTNITDVANQAPNVTLKAQGAAWGPSIAASIRGIGQYDFNPALEPGVGVYVDDVYYATLTGSVLDLLDLERVEILRGPQGTLAGKNSIGGAVKLYSQKAKGDDSGTVGVTYGSRNRMDLRGVADFAITDNLFARVSGVSKTQDGYVDRLDYGCANPGNPYGIPSLRVTSAGCVVDRDGNVDFSAVRASLRWLPSDNLEFNLSADYTSEHRNPAATVLLGYRTLTNPTQLQNIQPIQDANAANNVQGSAFVAPYGSFYNYAGFYSGQGVYNGFAAVGNIYDNVTYPPTTTLANFPLAESRAKPGATFDGGGTSLVIDWKIGGNLILKSVTAYRKYESSFTNDNDLSPLTSSIGDGNLPFESFSEEVRLSGAFGTDDNFEYTIGGFYMDQTSTYQSWQDLRYTPSYPLQFQQNDEVNADTQAAFVHLSYKILDPLTITAGGRYTQEHKDYTFVRLNRDGSVNPFLGTLNGLRSVYDGDNVDYRLAVQYSFTDDIMAYAQYSTGFKGGGTSPRPFFTWQAQPFNPETLKSAEVGAKMDFFDRKLRINPAVFQGKYKDIQLGLAACPPVTIPGGGTAPAAPCGQVANAGDATISGGEVEVTYRPIAGLSIDAAYSYLKFEWDYINPAVGGPSRPAGIQMSYVAPYMPESKWSVGVQYEFALGDMGTLTPRVDASNQGEMYVNANNNPSSQLAAAAQLPTSSYIEGYSLVNARITWRNADNKWEAALEGTNLTDEYYLLTRTDQYTGAGHTDGQPGRPREWAVTVKRKFK
jgi:iron complex outermembrane recepter protein